MTKRRSIPKKRVLIIGAGIAGAAVATRLGRAGVAVDLLEKEPRIGGHIRDLGCKAGDVCVRCNVCVAQEIIRTVAFIPTVSLYTETELMNLNAGNNGKRFRAVLGRVGTGGENEKQSVLDVDAVIIATGYDPFNPIENSSYSYGGIPNVITGIEAEQQLAAHHELRRVSDGERPQRVAFIQCVGSRTEEIFRRPEDTDYCSTVCCAYALRMARQLKYQADDTAVTIFYMDIQYFGKGFSAFYETCKQTMRFIRSRPYEIKAGNNGAVRVTYALEEKKEGGEGCVYEDEFDLVILSVGIRPRADAESVANICSVAMDTQGFFGIKGGTALPSLEHAGVYTVGASESPKDIAGCIAQADAVSTQVLRDIG